MAWKVIPVLRAHIAKELVEKYGFTQSKAASILGVSQASISYYLSMKRGKKAIELERVSEFKNTVKEVASKIAEGNLPPEEIVADALCNLCKYLRSSGMLSKL